MHAACVQHACSIIPCSVLHCNTRQWGGSACRSHARTHACARARARVHTHARTLARTHARTHACVCARAGIPPLRYWFMGQISSPSVPSLATSLWHASMRTGRPVRLNRRAYSLTFVELPQLSIFTPSNPCALKTTTVDYVDDVNDNCTSMITRVYDQSSIH